ncbi:prephenate dehydratase [Arachidicoccus rhizosphaerae]|uniref:prephenate dehydratase n=1 Tax=Arachidicoccus rhizosphaerae TaxID=551991 RepID=A0A1H3W8E2_9BACT|nr:prephenate dehydratase [Arachidicoccus rhizosphaerae]SDZ83111.1 prephenate dehydratase [Arachidicoccus rhizosphaerae]
MESRKGNTAPKKIAIQGYEGCFHQEAAQYYYGKQVEVIPCDSFRDVVKVASDKKISDGGIMAIENTIAGSILPNYNLLQKSKLKIVGEVYLLIRQNLMVSIGVPLEDIKEVHSHPMAIQQCFKFLDEYNWKLVETEDTALSARKLSKSKSPHVAVIASKLAAEIYDLELIAPNIHTLKNNYTRFLILNREEDVVDIPDANKASIYFHTDNSKGSLAKVLNKINEVDINLSKLQSFPIPGSDWKYSFHADMEFDSRDKFELALDLIRPLTEELRINGIYRKGKTI